MIHEAADLLKKSHCVMNFSISQFAGSHLTGTFDGTLEPDSSVSEILGPEGTQWQVDCQAEKLGSAMDLQVRFSLISGECRRSNVSVCLTFDHWSRENYVLMPAGAYNGNRYEAREMAYPPSLFGKEATGPDMPTIISDVPRLSIGDGSSVIRLMTRDLATPAVGFYSPGLNEGFWLLTRQETILGDSGIELEENSDRSSARLSISAPGVRPDFRYIIADTHFPSDDTAHDFKQGEQVEIKLRLHFFKCSGIQSLFDRFTDIRKELAEKNILKNILPFSAAWEIQEKKYYEQNWEDTLGYYSVGMRENPVQDWQVGWTGGMIATYPLLFEGSPISKQRALKNFDFLFSRGQDKSGLFYGLAYRGEFFGDYDAEPGKRAHLIRRSGDALYYIVKQFLLIKMQDNTAEIPFKWLDGTKKCADALVRLWDQYGQFGQFADSLNGGILIGGSVCGGIVPAALALAWEYFKNPDYLRAAQQAAQDYHEKFVKNGVTTGGPGDMLQCPDSESAFGLLESFVTLYEVDGAQQWLDYSKDMANQCFTWCVSYDYRFPPDSTFGKLDMRTTGSVYANVQNKHSAPGICTHSGLSLLKLYRATGETKYLELIREMAHNMPQYLSREDRPIAGLVNFWTDFKEGRWYPENMPAGWMNERVQMSDWLEPVGEVFWGSCWCEISNMLAFVEIPGLYIQPDTGFMAVIDHVEAEIIESNPRGVFVQITNPTDFNARVKILAEDSADLHQALGQNALFGCQQAELCPGEQKTIFFSRKKG